MSVGSAVSGGKQKNGHGGKRKRGRASHLQIIGLDGGGPGGVKELIQPESGDRERSEEYPREVQVSSWKNSYSHSKRRERLTKLGGSAKWIPDPIRRS